MLDGIDGWYILDDDKNVIPCRDFQSRQEWLETIPVEKRTPIGCRVDQWEQDGIRVSTVFLGLDHGYGLGPPVVFETMIFGGDRDQDGERYSTWGEAQAGHNRIVEQIKSSLTTKEK